MKLKISVFFIVSLILFSCKSKKQAEEASELNYMQNIEDIAVQASINSAKNNTIQVGDQLIILFTAKDNDVVKPFNQNYSSSEYIQNPVPGGNTPTTGNASITGPSYFVDAEGNIDLPILGRINTTGKSVESLKDELHSKMTRYVINPTVNIRLANFKITILGEVNRSGDYTLANGNGTIMNALGLAGDLTMYGKRDNVLVVRNVDGEITKGKINLVDANFINSPFYNLKQNDVIYVAANKTKEKASKLDPNMPIYISVAGILVTILALIFK